MARLDGRAAIVTGASRGIGAAAAEALAAEGAAVLLCARSAEDVEGAAAGIRAGGGRAEAFPADVARYPDMAEAVARCRTAFGGVDILVNNAGVIEPIGHLAETDPDEWGRLIDINLKGVYHGLRAALPEMEKAGRGVVINVSSGAATTPLEGWSGYCASKAGVLMLTRAADAEYGARGVQVVGLSPGTVATEMQRVIKGSGLNPVSRLDWSDHIPPDWAGRAVAWLAAEGAAEFAGGDVSLRDEAVRRRVGLA
jgi:NAD(P)-dependent dehydrogenase (short-subunit alcohol dehydrogenase family)